MGKPGVGGAQGGVWFKKVGHALNVGNTRPNPHVKEFWAYDPMCGRQQGTIPNDGGPNWTKVPGMDVAGEGDVKHIANWPASYSF